MKLNEVVALVTGGASGLGEATVRNIVEQGGKAVIVDLQDERAQSLVEQLGDAVTYVKTDVSNEEQVIAELITGLKRLEKLMLQSIVQVLV